MSTVREIKNRIVTIKNIQNVTDAIQKIASARVSKTKNKAVNLKKYVESCDEIAMILQRNILQNNNVDHPFFKKNENIKESLFIIITGDKGLCGGFYSRIFDFINEVFKDKDKDNLNLIVFGKKGVNYFNKRNYKVLLNHINLPVFYPKIDLKEIANTAIEKFINNEIREVNIIYNQYISATRYEPVLKQILPINLNKKGNNNYKSEMYLYEPDLSSLIENFLPDYIHNQIWEGIIESIASEQASRMIMMERASHSAKDMIDDLTKQRNKNRQSAITKELSEIVGTTDALENE